MAGSLRKVLQGVIPMQKLSWSQRLNRKLVYTGLRGMKPTQLDLTFGDISVEFFQDAAYRRGLPSLLGSLRNLKAQGFVPAFVLDIGANQGQWTREASTVFPETKFFMIEANPAHSDHLAETVKDLAGRASYKVQLLGPTYREKVPFYQVDAGDQWLWGSSVLPELTSYPRTSKELAMETLDNYALPLLVKLDVQGYELEVLRGGQGVLREAEVILLEASLLKYNEGGPLFDEVVAFMKEAGFVAYDIAGQWRRQTDSVLFQIDMVFVKEDSQLRRHKKFWEAEP
jgi:FkbM family methyltransferase